MQGTFPRRIIGDALDAMGRDPEDTVREDYSGRGMYGATCFGIISDHPTFMLMLGAEIARVINESYREDDVPQMLGLLIDMCDAARSDQMATDTIIYFPGWTLGEDD